MNIIERRTPGAEKAAAPGHGVSSTMASCSRLGNVYKLSSTSGACGSKARNAHRRRWVQSDVEWFSWWQPEKIKHRKATQANATSQALASEGWSICWKRAHLRKTCTFLRRQFEHLIPSKEELEGPFVDNPFLDNPICILKNTETF